MSTRTPLTSTTWADLAGTGLLPREALQRHVDRGRIERPKNRPFYWDDLADLEHELVALSAAAKELGGWKRSLTIETARALVSACHSGYPVMLTWDTKMNELHFGERHIERKSTAVIVDQIFPPSGNQPGYMYVSYCGFHHSVYFHEVVEAHVFDTVVTWHSPEEA